MNFRNKKSHILYDPGLSLQWSTLLSCDTANDTTVKTRATVVETITHRRHIIKKKKPLS